MNNDIKQNLYENSESSSLIILEEDRANHKNEQLYLKKIVKQDLIRTPTFSQNSIHDFFKIHLKNGESKQVSIINQTTNKDFAIEFKMRGTRSECRVFLNDLFNELDPFVGDILIFSKFKSDKYICVCISKNSNKYNFFDTHFEIGKNHAIIYSSLL